MKLKLNSKTTAPAQIPKGIKWDHYCELVRSGTIRRHLPKTLRLNKRALMAMLTTYKTVFAKPNRGAFGEGVMKVQQNHTAKGTTYTVRSGTRQKTFYSGEALYAFISKNKVKKDYLVQQGIDLLQRNQRPFDLRLMIKKQDSGAWRNEGFVGRLAAPKKIVTNIRSGGTAFSIEDLLRAYVNRQGRQRIVKTLNDLGNRVCGRLEKLYPGISLFGIDMGLDRSMKPWIIEVNTRPEKICWKCMRKLYRKNKKSL